MNKACPVVLRTRNNQTEILIFRHPLAGIQMAKGTIEAGESSLEASERELWEEAGITLKAQFQLLEWQRYPSEPTWGICIMEDGNGLPEQWAHYCEDDGGHVFEYFWHPLLQEPGADWYLLFVDALKVLCKALAKTPL